MTAEDFVLFEAVIGIIFKTCAVNAVISIHFLYNLLFNLYYQ